MLMQGEGNGIGGGGVGGEVMEEGGQEEEGFRGRGEGEGNDARQG